MNKSTVFDYSTSSYHISYYTADGP